ncbi:MAG: hypothetical protein OXH75_24135 [Acidobacteria bacterium]|nr:hypothetical protein [Acidobacteriota bacterium]
MSEEQLHSPLVRVVIAAAIPTFLYLLRTATPYGRLATGIY